MSMRSFESPPGSARRRAGMTLVEIMVSLVVLSFGLLGVAALQVRAITESSGGQHLSTASALARNRIEELSRLAWDAAVLADSGGNWGGATVLPIADEIFTRSERITNDVAAPDTEVKAIEVRVSWSDEKRQNRSVVLSSARLREVDE
ncbi:MAG: prepilin-type N-terminal cleavage/methylation domain-containing protein [Myxococcota bacterium]